ncbi:MAG: tetratricopeptide repeat protein [Bacteroidota bacterium]
MKKYTLVALSILSLGFVKAQTLEEAIKKTDNERYEEAGKVFRALIAKDAANASNYFYYGENYYQGDDLDSAIIVWKKGNAIDAANALSMVGMGKSLWLKGDTTAGKKYFDQAISSTKNKNAEVLRQIGACLTQAEKNSLTCAESFLRTAVKLDPKNVDGHLLLGDVLLELNPTNASEAMKSYNTALDIQKAAKVIVRKAKIYQRAQNPQLADELYNEAETAEPNYAPAYREHAELAMRFNQTQKAITKWQKYLELNDNNYSRYRYASALFTGKKYAEAVTEFQNVHAKGFKNFYSARLLAYSLYEANAEGTDQAKFLTAQASLNEFFTIVPQDKIIGMDYKYQGMIETKLGLTDNALKSFEKAAEVDKALAPEIYTDLAKNFMLGKNYDGAIKYYGMKATSDATKMTVAEYYDLARAFYFGPKDYAKALEAYTKVAELAADYAPAYLGMARSNVNLDLKKVTWGAQANYQQFISTVKPEEVATQTKNLIEAYKYLGDFYVNSPSKDPVKAKEVWGKVLELDPADKQAKAYFGAK